MLVEAACGAGLITWTNLSEPKARMLVESNETVLWLPIRLLRLEGTYANVLLKKRGCISYSLQVQTRPRLPSWPNRPNACPGILFTPLNSSLASRDCPKIGEAQKVW
jgi:hypothetical protein